ncbi:MAG: tetratricopeptide repeat protein [Clostridiales bacterium]|nr:tetratricopeptide repeat protein [Clostridiales bacterium]
MKRIEVTGMNENINALLREFKDCCEEEENPERVKNLNKSIVSYYKRNGLTESENFACHMYNLSLFYINSDDFSSALKHGKTALSIAQKTGNDKLYAKFSDNLGVIYSCLGDKNTGLFWFKKGYNLTVKFPGLYSDEEMCSAALNLGSGYSENGSHENALKYHKKALKLKKEKDLDYANILNLIGYDLESLKKYEEAAGYLRSALDIYEKYCYDDDDDYIANISYIANVYKQDGNLEKALTSYEKAIFLLKKAGLGEEPFYGELLNKAAEIYSETGNDKRALELRSSALKVFEKRIGNKNLFYANCLRKIADIYYRNFIYGTAISYLQRALDIKSSIMSVEDREYLNDFILLAEIYDKNNQKERATEIYEYLLANISEKSPVYRKIIFKLAARFRISESGDKLYDLYDKYRKADPTATFDEFLIMAETIAEV